MSHEDRLARVVLRTMHPSSTPSVLHCIVVFNACPFCLDLRCCGSKCQPPARLPSSASACTGATCRVPSRLDLPELRLIPCMIPGISSAQLIRLWRSVPLFGKTRKAMAPSRKSHTSLCSSIEISIFFRLCFFFLLAWGAGHVQWLCSTQNYILYSCSSESASRQSRTKVLKP